MLQPAYPLLSLLLPLALAAGCATDGSAWRANWWRRPATTAANSTSSDTSAIKAAASVTAGASATDKTVAAAGAAGDETSAAGHVDAQALLAVLAELKSSGAIDEVTQQRLVEDLKQTDPSLWPQMLDVFRASLAYRQKYAAEAGDASNRLDDAPHDAAPRRLAAPARAAAADVAQRLDAEGLTAGQQLARQLEADRRARPEVQLASATSAGEPDNRPETQTSEEPAPEAKEPSGKQHAASEAAAAAEPQPLDWRGHLGAAIAGLENETAGPPATTGAIGRHAGLRMLYLLDGRRDAALQPIPGISATQQDFWSSELFGLSTLLDTERNADESRRAAAAAVPLREAQAKLGELATLTVRNLAFCAEVHSYGVYKKFPKYEFQAGQEVLLYAEVENFKSVPGDKGFHTSLKSSYQILDHHGARVDQKDFDVTAEDCQNPRRDYFIRYFVWMPKRIYGGTYTLQLSIEDTQSQKIGQSSIEFTIAEREQ